MTYELWRDDSLNLSASFRTEAEALAAVRDELEHNGPAVVLRSLLARADSRGRRTTLAEGQELVDRARQASAATNGRAPSVRRPTIPA